VIEQDLHKVCPECAGEYRFDVERCADCDVPLVFPEQIAARDARELRPSPWLFMLRTAPIAWVRALASDLDKKGIAYRIDRRRAREDGLLTLSVRSQDRRAAKAIDDARWRIEEPDSFAAAASQDAKGLYREPPSFKVCPRCGGEYRLDARICADCGSALVLPDEEDARVEQDAAAGGPEAEQWLEVDPDLVENLPYSGVYYELPPSDDLVCICCRFVRQVQRLSLDLDRAQIPHRIDPAPFGDSTINCLYALPADGDRAAAMDDALWSVPLEGSDSADLSVCPACAKTYLPGARECSGCGLVVGLGPDLDKTCSRCGAVIGPAVLHCPNCAADMPRI
jgi:predicted amidophosphoribosyltransferase